MMFKRQEDAKAHDAKMRTDVARGVYVDPRAGKATLQSYGETWLAAQTFDRRPAKR